MLAQVVPDRCENGAWDLAVPFRDERLWLAASVGRQPDHMDRPQAIKDGQPIATAAPRFAVIIGKPADDGSACRIEEPGRLLRVRSLLKATYEQMGCTVLPPEGMPRLQRQLQAIRHDLEQAVSPPLAAELRRVLPPQDAAPSAGALRIECAVLLSWTSSLVIQMLSALEAARERLPEPSAAA